MRCSHDATASCSSSRQTRSTSDQSSSSAASGSMSGCTTAAQTGDGLGPTVQFTSCSLTAFSHSVLTGELSLAQPIRIEAGQDRGIGAARQADDRPLLGRRRPRLLVRPGGCVPDRIVSAELDPRPLEVQVEVVELNEPGTRQVALVGHGAHQLTVVDVATHHHRLAGLDVGAEPDQQPRQPAPALVDRQICHSPPRSTGTRAPSSFTPSTSISGLPIMKSMWMELEFTCCLSRSSLTR